MSVLSLPRSSRRILSATNPIRASISHAACSPQSPPPPHHQHRSLSSARASAAAASSDRNSLPLAGLKVLDLSRVLAGPFCTQILADYGADVLKIEQPGVGDETRLWRTAAEAAEFWTPARADMSLYYAAVNRNKRSATLNLKDPEAVRIVRRLARSSDVVVHNFVPGKIEAMGLGYDVLRAENERLIYASVSGYGTSGPNRDRAGYDAIALAEAGLLHVTGERGGPPTKPGVAIGDMSTGLYAHGAILAALYQRDRTGVGAKIEASLFETGLSLLINVGLSALNMRRAGERWGLGHPSLVPYGGFRTADDKVVFLAANNNRQWQLLCRTIGLAHLLEEPRYASNDKRVDCRAELDAIMQRTVGSKTKDEWMTLLEGTGLPYGAINDVVEAVEHPQTAAREMVMDVKDVEAVRDGLLRLIAPAVKIEGTKLDVVRRQPPGLGEHTEEVLGGLGYSSADVAKLREAGVV